MLCPPLTISLTPLHLTQAAPEPLPEGIEPLVLWAPPPGVAGEPIVVDPMLTRFLRPHQREGVAFMFECVTGQRVEGGQGEGRQGGGHQHEGVASMFLSAERVQI